MSEPEQSIDANVSATTDPRSLLSRAQPHLRLGAIVSAIAFWLLIGAVGALVVIGPTMLVSLVTVLILGGGAALAVVLPLVSYGLERREA